MAGTRKATVRTLRLGRGLAAGGALAAVLAGCGSQQPYANAPRPPAPITLSAYIGDGRVSVSPRHFGAGPISLVITNQTRKAQRLTLESDRLGAEKPGIAQSTGPINPQETATIQVDVARGRYSVHTASERIRAATLVVGAPRPSSQDELLLP